MEKVVCKRGKTLTHQAYRPIDEPSTNWPIVITVMPVDYLTFDIQYH